MLQSTLKVHTAMVLNIVAVMLIFAVGYSKAQGSDFEEPSADYITCHKEGNNCDITYAQENCVKMYNLKLEETEENRITDLRYGSRLCICTY